MTTKDKDQPQPSETEVKQEISKTKKGLLVAGAVFLLIWLAFKSGALGTPVLENTGQQLPGLEELPLIWAAMLFASAWLDYRTKAIERSLNKKGENGKKKN